MKVVRTLLLVLLFVYSGATLGLYFHSHSAGPQHTAKCQICQHSQVDQEQVSVAELAAEDVDYGVCGVEQIVSARLQLTIRLCGRAPPTC